MGKKTKKRNKMKTIKGVFCLILLVILIVGIVFLGVLTNIIDKRNSMKIENQKISEIIKAAKEYKENDIPENLKDAVIAIEDKRFMKHRGIDYIRTMGAIFSFVKNAGESNYGGSTITQQLIKVTTLDNDRSWTRKIREWTRAVYIEKKLSKDQIITAYLNSIYLGSGNIGVYETAKDFFNKEIAELTLEESAVIAATIQSPERTNPYRSTQCKEMLIDRKDVVLKEMYNLGKISNKEYTDAISKKITFSKEITEEKTLDLKQISIKMQVLY